jgi:replication factor A1
MQINELQARQGKIDIEVEVLDIGDIREFDKFGKKGRVASATVKDDSGQVILTLWNEEIDKVTKGCKLKVSNGYCSEFQNKKQLTAGRFGKLEVL